MKSFAKVQYLLNFVLNMSFILKCLSEFHAAIETVMRIQRMMVKRVTRSPVSLKCKIQTASLICFTFKMIYFSILSLLRKFIYIIRFNFIYNSFYLFRHFTDIPFLLIPLLVVNYAFLSYNTQFNSKQLIHILVYLHLHTEV